MESPITNECDALREEVAMLEAENRRMRNELLEARKVPAVPEVAIRAVWEHGHYIGSGSGFPSSLSYTIHAEEVGRIFVEAMRDA